jgi:hypothetical protein
MKFKKIIRKTLTLNSHSLSYFQRCEQYYKYQCIDNLEQKEEYYPFTKGAFVSKILELWYRAKKLKYSLKRMEELEFKLFKALHKFKGFKNGDNLLIASRVQLYFEKYRHEKYKKVIAVEAGFSKVLYEDNYVLYIYEGRPDLVVELPDNMGLAVVDHKTETMRANIYHYNNQAMGYLWAIGCNTGLYNYIGLQKDAKDGDVLRREAFTFTNAQIEQWRQDTIMWYNRIINSTVNNKFLRSWNCSSKYGNCFFTDVCEAPNERVKLIQIEKNFKKGMPYKSW